MLLFGHNQQHSLNLSSLKSTLLSSRQFFSMGNVSKIIFMILQVLAMLQNSTTHFKYIKVAQMDYGKHMWNGECMYINHCGAINCNFKI